MKRVVTILALVAVAASFSFADGHMIKAGGLTIHTEGGTWQLIGDALAQTDAEAPLAAAWTDAGQTGKAEYKVNARYIGGLEDNAGAIGVGVDGFAMILVWDPATRGGSGLWAEVYNIATRQLHEYAGITYQFEIPDAVVAAVAPLLQTAALPIQVRVDSSNGNVSFKDPRDRTTWWAFTLGQELENANIVGVGTSSMSASFSL